MGPEGLWETLPGIRCAAGMTSVPYAKVIRVFDYARLADRLHGRIRERAQQLAEKQGAKIDSIVRAHSRNDDVEAKVSYAGRRLHGSLVPRDDHTGPRFTSSSRARDGSQSSPRKSPAY